MSELFVSSPEDLGQVILVEQRGEQHPFVAPDALEAMQNVAKYANASLATVRLHQEDGALSFSVTEDGDGFDTSRTEYGTGLQGMGDRLSALGGTLHVTSEPMTGTTVTGRLPVH
jgi:signal transduction histidine kinase